MMNNELYLKDSYINKNIFYLFNTEIYEYDMKEAGLSLTSEFKLQPDKVVEKLRKMNKDDMHVAIGNLQRNDETYKESLKKAFVEGRKLFLESNNLEETDIISIKKDAIFTIKKCDICDFGEFIHFRPKNTYSSYIKLKHLELYYNKEKLDVKGIGDNIRYHENYMCDFIKKYFYRMETSQPSEVIAFVRRFIDKYKKGELKCGYYREFNGASLFKFRNNDGLIAVNPDGEYFKNLNGDCNYNLLINLIKIPL